MKKITKKNLHILIILAGIIFNAIGIFHTTVWFDEAYSVGMATHSFKEIWEIGGNDVHPVLYYWVLRVINLITNGSIIGYRIFSAFCIAALGIIGFTHIRKDFGEKVGILFSFFVLFLPASCLFANEIRMYSMAILLVTIFAIYANRIYKGDTSWKNWIIFALSSLACIYTHYYGLMIAGIISLIMLFKFVKYKRTESLIRLIGVGVFQLVLYIPWLLSFLTQLKHVSKGFWIGFEFPKTLFELTAFQITGKCNEYFGFAVAVIFYTYIGFKIYKSKKENIDIKSAKISLGLYVTTIIAALLVSLAATTMILFYRYLFVVTGLYIFGISFILSKEKKKWIVSIVCSVILLMSIFTNIIMTKNNYDKENTKPIEYIKENIKPEDTILYSDSDAGMGSVISINFMNNRSIMYNGENWQVEEAYRAFGDNFEVHINTDFIKELKGRVWIIQGYGDNTKKLFNQEDIEVKEQKEFKTSYQDYFYKITLIEINN